MKVFVLLLAVAAAHVAILFTAYGTGLFGLASLVPFAAYAWLILPTAVAAYVYEKVAALTLTKRRDRIAVATVATIASLYVGVYAAFNTFGT